MPEIISCPSCRRKLQAPESVLGQDVQCPTCGATFTASFGAAPSPPPARELPERRDEDDRRPRPARDRYQDDYGLDDEFGQRRSPRGHGTAPHRGPVILTLGILALAGLVICLPSLILGPIAWAMGNNDLSLMRAGRMDREGEGATTGGHTCGMVATILGVIGIVLLCMMEVLGERGIFFRRRW